MKKNRVMRFASAVLILTLLSTSIISGTFAKYVTKEEGTDTARVATWGFVSEYGASEVEITDLFLDSYTNVQTAVEGENLIAPGTTNAASFAFKYAGAQAAPEVAYTFSVSTEGSEIAEDIEDNTNIKWYLDGELAGTNGTWDELLADIKALSGEDDGEATYDPGELPEGFEKDAPNHIIKWEWVFYTSDAQDEIDTGMGNKTALDEVTIKITITATQID